MLGLVLLERGQFAAAQKATRRALDLLPPEAAFRAVALRQLQQCDRFLVLEMKLPTILKGQQHPASAAESLELARFCQQVKQLHGAASRFFTEAFASESQLADDLRAQHRYNAACSAAQAGCGRGKDADQLDAKERVRWRKQALDWLRADLAQWRKQLQAGPADLRAAVVPTLGRWQKDPDLGGVRDKQALAALPTEERRAWEQLWADVAALLDRARKGK
jgi:hypothetical protein